MKVIGLRNLTTDIIRFVTQFVGALSQLEEQRSNQHIRDQFQKFRDLLVNIKDTDTRTSALQTLESMQNELINLRAKTMMYKP